MGLINKTTLNFIVKQGEKLVESSVVKKPDIASFDGLRYMPQDLLTDVVEVSKPLRSYEKFLTKDLLKPLSESDKKRKEIAEELGISVRTLRIYLKKLGLYKPITELRTPKDTMKQARLQELVSKGLSLNEIAEELGVKVGKVRWDLSKYNIISDVQKEFRMLKGYFTATTKEDKAKAFEEIDKYLGQIAKEELKLKKGSSYEDCLQDVRLRFFEIVDKSKQNGVSFPYSILRIMRNERPPIQQEIKSVGLSKADLRAADRGIKSFEAKDYDDYLWKYAYRHIREREVYSLEQYLREDKTIKEIAEHFCFTPSRMKDIIEDALPRLQEQFELAKLVDFSQERIKFSQKVAENAAAK